MYINGYLLKWAKITVNEWQNNSMIIESDASKEGWGAHSNGVSTGGQWSQSEQFLHINCLELLAGSFAIKCFAKDKTNIHTAPDGQCDCTYIHQQNGGNQTPCPSLSVSRPLAVVSSEADNSVCHPHPRDPECEHRQGI